MKMKTYLLMLALGFVCLCVLQGALSPVVQQTSPLGDQMIPDPQNPYCCSIPLQFPPPAIQCPDNEFYYELDIVCATFCVQEYQDKMIQIYNDACTKWSRNDQAYVDDCKMAIHNYEICAAHAHNPVQLDLCRDQMIADFNKALKKLNAARADIKRDVDAKSASAVVDFNLCIHDCCHIVGHKKKAEEVEPK
jgi:hypothetical protein